jgi:hypothetical protein
MCIYVAMEVVNKGRSMRIDSISYQAQCLCLAEALTSFFLTCFGIFSFLFSRFSSFIAFLCSYYLLESAATK